MMPRSFFEKIYFGEAEGDEEEPEETTTAADPPDVAEPATDDTGDVTDAPLDDDAPPDIGDIGTDLGDTAEDQLEEPEISEKISMVMNANLYQRFLTLSNTVNNQLTNLKGNNDSIYAMAPKGLDILEPLSKLGENIRLYLSNNFLDSNYSKNLLFYNKCLNLLQLLNDLLSKELRKAKIE